MSGYLKVFNFYIFVILYLCILEINQLKFYLFRLPEHIHSKPGMEEL